jgi:hypothetical protein
VLTYSENGLRKSVELKGINSLEDYIEYCCFSPNQKVREIFWRRHVSNVALQVLKTAVNIEKLLALFEYHSKNRQMEENKLKKFCASRVAACDPGQAPERRAGDAGLHAGRESLREPADIGGAAHALPIPEDLAELQRDDQDDNKE